MIFIRRVTAKENATRKMTVIQVAIIVLVTGTGPTWKTVSAGSVMSGDGTVSQEGRWMLGKRLAPRGPAIKPTITSPRTITASAIAKGNEQPRQPFLATSRPSRCFSCCTRAV